jgi:hypothetical protein
MKLPLKKLNRLPKKSSGQSSAKPIVLLTCSTIRNSTFIRQNGASIASLLLTTDAIVSEIPEKKETPSGMPPGGMY